MALSSQEILQDRAGEDPDGCIHLQQAEKMRGKQTMNPGPAANRGEGEAREEGERRKGKEGRRSEGEEKRGSSGSWAPSQNPEINT